MAISIIVAARKKTTTSFLFMTLLPFGLPYIDVLRHPSGGRCVSESGPAAFPLLRTTVPRKTILLDLIQARDRPALRNNM